LSFLLFVLLLFISFIYIIIIVIYLMYSILFYFSFTISITYIFFVRFCSKNILHFLIFMMT